MGGKPFQFLARLKASVTLRYVPYSDSLETNKYWSESPTK